MEAKIDSFKRVWQLYFELVCLLRIYVVLGPMERWLQKLSDFMSCMDLTELHGVFVKGTVFCGVYVWVSVLTGKMYVGSSRDFRQRTYSHVRSLRKAPQQHVHRFLRGFGKHLFVHVPLVACPLAPLRRVEEAIIGVIQPGLNREWMPIGGDRRKARALLGSAKHSRPLLVQRSGGLPPSPPKVCTATFLAGGLCLPSIPAALTYAFEMKLKSFSLSIGAGNVHLMLRHQLHRIFDKSCVSVEGHSGLQQVPLAQCWSVLLKPVHTPFVVTVHSFTTVGWCLWATETLSRLIRRPDSRRDLYRLDQLSFVRLWRTAQQWDKASEKQKLLQ